MNSLLNYPFDLPPWLATHPGKSLKVLLQCYFWPEYIFLWAKSHVLKCLMGLFSDIITCYIDLGQRRTKQDLSV